jgi:hypothetical protein
VAQTVQGEKRALALEAAAEANEAELMSRAIDIDRDIVNYKYWKLRCDFEPQDNTLEARKLTYDGDQAFTSAQLLAARDKYVESLKKWRLVLDAYPQLLEDQITVEELAESVDRYRGVLQQLDEKLPEPFVLQDLLDANQRFSGGAVAVQDEAAKERSEAEAADPSKQ